MDEPLSGLDALRRGIESSRSEPGAEGRCPVCFEIHTDDMVSHVIARHGHDAPQLLTLAARSEPLHHEIGSNPDCEWCQRYLALIDGGPIDG